jgi:hypothetical protein
VYRWEWNDTEKTIFESKDNLKIKKSQHTTTYKNNGGDSVKTKGNNKNKLWSKLKSWWT